MTPQKEERRRRGEDDRGDRGGLTRVKRAPGIWLLCAATIAGCGVRHAVPPEPPAAVQPPDQETLARLRAGSMLTWRGEDQRIAYANMDKLAPTNRVRRGARPSALPEAPQDFSGFRYTFGGASHGLDHFMHTLNVVGVLVITDGRIVLERYARGHTAQTRWESWSVAKPPSCTKHRTKPPTDNTARFSPAPGVT